MIKLEESRIFFLCLRKFGEQANLFKENPRPRGGIPFTLSDCNVDIINEI